MTNGFRDKDDAIVHLHFCVSSAQDCQYALDINAYLGPDLTAPPPPNWMDPIQYNGPGSGTGPLTASWASPSNSQTISSRTVRLQANVSGGSGSGYRVAFSAKYGGNWYGVDTVSSSPYAYDWDLCNAGVPDGDIELGLEAWDSTGNHYVYSEHHTNYHITKNYNNCGPPPATSTPPPPPTGRWTAKFFNGTDFNDGPKCTREYDAFFREDWSGRKPCNEVSSNENWSARFEGTFSFAGADYYFYLDHDDGVKLCCKPGPYYIYYRWDSPGSGWSDPANLSGNIPLTLEYTQRTGGARLEIKWSTQRPVPDPPALESPGNGAILSEGSSINLSWSTSGDQYYGEVWGGPAGTTSFGWQSEPSKNIGSQWAGYTYSWHVKAKNSGGESGWSSTWTFTVKPATPTNLSAQVTSCSQVNLSWSDNSGSEEGYKIYRNGSYVGQTGMNATTYQDPELSGNSTYSYIIKAFRGSIESDASNTVEVTTSACETQPPTLYWIAPGGNEEVHIASGGVVQLEVSATDSSGIRDVKFWRWDAPNQLFVDVGLDSSSPYVASMDVSTLNMEWNEVDAVATDNVGNWTWNHIWLYRLPCDDYNENGLVDTSDIQRIASYWHQISGPPYHVGGDGRVTIADP